MAMADLTISGTPLASVKAKKRKGTAGATITHGQTLYEDTSDLDSNGTPKLKLADADSTTAAVRKCAGTALHGAVSGEPIQYVEEDPEYTPGGTLVVGTSYYLSDTPGGIMPVADLEIGDYPTFLFVAYSTTQANMKMVQGTAAIP
jgi:hypothetical protein